jgi:hypothetical protein
MFEDPMYSTPVAKEIFVEIYGRCLETLDGEDEVSFVDFFFEPSPVNNTLYLFRNEDARLDFRDLAIELGLIPEVIEIMEGESKAEKAARKGAAVSYKAENPKPKPKKTEDNPLPNVQFRTQQAQKTLERLMLKLKEETEPKVRESLERKIAQTLKYLDTSV